MDQPKIERMLRLMKLLSGNVNYSIGELADKLEMSPRTIYRYLDTFKSAGFEVHKLHSDIYKLGTMPKTAPDFDRLIWFSEEEAYLVNSLLDRLDRSNSLKANLKDKLAVIYDSTSIADFVDKKSCAASVDALGEAAKEKRKVILRNYESGNSNTVRDRLVEPFAFTTDYVDVWAYDLEDGANKLFKVSRIGSVDVLDEGWTAEGKHERTGRDIFRMSGPTATSVRLQLSVMAKNLLVEEFPLAARDLRRDGAKWILDTQVRNVRGVGRFVAGLPTEIKVLEGEELKEYLRNIKFNL